MKRRNLAAVAAMAIMLMVLGSCQRTETEVKDKAATDAKAAEAAVKEREARDTAIEGYIYAYPLVTMELTRRVMTNVEKADATRAPMGQFLRIRTYPPVDDHAVTAPNADTL